MLEIIKLFISWTHGITSMIALIIGAIVLFQRKGGQQHKKLGGYYFYSMIIGNTTALMIYNAFGEWFFPHWLAVITLAVILPGFLITKKKQYKHWLKIHIASMVISYYMLIGGAINEAFLHISTLRPYFINNDPIVGITHFIAQLFFIIVLTYYLIKYRRKQVSV